MKPGTILRGCTFLEEEHTAALENSIQKKTDEISEEAKESFKNILDEYESSFHEKLNCFETYKDEIEEKFNKEIANQKIQFEKTLLELEEEHKRLTNKLEESFQKHIDNTQSDIKEIMITLFEKFFFEEYQNTDNLESLIRSTLTQLEDSKEVQLEMNSNYLAKLRTEKSELIEELLSKNINISSHSKQDLICEFKSDIGNIEINFKKQIEKIKESINIY